MDCLAPLVFVVVLELAVRWVCKETVDQLDPLVDQEGLVKPVVWDLQDLWA